MKKILVVGTGNLLLKDEGAGIHAAKALGSRFIFSPEIEIIDGGTMGLDLLPLMEGREKVLIIDAVDFGREPGFCGTVEGDRVPPLLGLQPAVHDVGITGMLAAARWSLSRMPDLCLAGIQPASLEVGIELTPRVQAGMDTFIETIVEVLQGWGVTCSGRPDLGQELYST
jgi:hydrogenase maturation protease